MMNRRTRIPTLSQMSDAPASVLARGRWDVIVPEETMNLIVNPSLEVDLTGWSVNGANTTITRDTTLSTHGMACMSFVCTNSAGANQYTESDSAAAQAGVPYTLSFWFRKVCQANAKGRIYLIFRNAGNAVIAQVGQDLPIGPVSEWTRFVMTAFAPVNTAFVSAYVATTDNVPSGQSFTMKIDGVQIEAKAYATTYCDGTQEGCLWLSTAHNSLSIRNRTKAGGRIVNLKSLKWATATVVGLSAASVQPIATPYAQIGGALYQRTVMPARTFQIGGGWECDSDVDLHRNRQALINALSASGANAGELTRLIYTPLGNGCDSDSINTPAEKSVVIDAAYSGGLEGAWANEVGQERATMVFTSYLPFMAIGSSPFTQSQTFSGKGNTDIWIASYDVKQRQWFKPFEPNDDVGEGVLPPFYDIVIGRGRDYYICGQFDLTGASKAALLAKWDGTQWLRIDNGTTPSVFNGNGLVARLAVGLDGSLYAAGTFTTIAGVSASRIARYNGSTWSALGSGISGGDVKAMAVAPDGTLWVGGDFRFAGGLSTYGIASWNGSAWTVYNALAEPTTALAVATDGTVYAAMGDYPAQLAKRSGSNFVAVTATFFDHINAIASTRNGGVYVGGQFAPGSPYNAPGTNLAYFNGTAWSNPFGSGTNGTVADLTETVDGRLMIAGAFTSAAGVGSQGYIEFAGGKFVRSKVDFGIDPVNAPVSMNLVAANDQYELIGGKFTATASPVATLVTVNGVASNARFVFTAGGSAGYVDTIFNRTTGSVINFDSLLLQPNETVILTIGAQASLISNQRGDLSRYIRAGSDLTSFKIINGVNEIEAGADVPARLEWKNQYTSLDAVH